MFERGCGEDALKGQQRDGGPLNVADVRNFGSDVSHSSIRQDEHGVAKASLRKDNAVKQR